MSVVVLVTGVGAAAGARAAAAALACAGSGPDRAGLLIDFAAPRPPRPALLATVAARELEERLVSHLPEAGVASRGRACHLALPADPDGIDRAAAALPLARDAVAVLHLPPALLQPVLAEPRIRPAGALLRADLAADRAPAALAARDLMERGIRVAVQKRPLAWLDARLALLGLSPAATVLPDRLRTRLLDESEDNRSRSQRCYAALDDQEADPARAARQERRGDEGPRRGRGLHRDPQRGAGR